MKPPIGHVAGAVAAPSIDTTPTHSIRTIFYAGMKWPTELVIVTSHCLLSRVWPTSGVS